ncbi:MAG: hypothetical protein RJB57_962 [Actinomycetota bacterium]
MIVLVTSLVFGGTNAPPVDPWTAASNLVFRATINEFATEAGSTAHDPRLDWSSDGCSAPVLGSTGRSFDFTLPCRRHDFAYRNLGRMEGGRRWTPALRNRVDRRFLTDMRTHCSARPRIDRGPCRTWANLYYTVVRGFSRP